MPGRRDPPSDQHRRGLQLCRADGEYLPPLRHLRLERRHVFALDLTLTVAALELALDGAHRGPVRHGWRRRDQFPPFWRLCNELRTDLGEFFTRERDDVLLGGG